MLGDVLVVSELQKGLRVFIINSCMICYVILSLLYLPPCSEAPSASDDPVLRHGWDEIHIFAAKVQLFFDIYKKIAPKHDF